MKKISFRLQLSLAEFQVFSPNSNSLLSWSPLQVLQLFYLTHPFFLYLLYFLLFPRLSRYCPVLQTHLRPNHGTVLAIEHMPDHGENDILILAGAAVSHLSRNKRREGQQGDDRQP